MAQYEDYSKHTHVPPQTDGSSAGSVAFVIGALVLFVGIIAWFVFGSDVDNATVPAGAGNDGGVIMEDGTAPAADPATDGGAAMEQAPPADGGAGGAGGGVIEQEPAAN